MFNIIAKGVKTLFSNSAVRKVGKGAAKNIGKHGHKFLKHPAKHANKAVKAAFKVGVETGKKF